MCAQGLICPPTPSRARQKEISDLESAVEALLASNRAAAERLEREEAEMARMAATEARLEAERDRLAAGKEHR